jgi:hypothetical protein
LILRRKFIDQNRTTAEPPPLSKTAVDGLHPLACTATSHPTFFEKDFVPLVIKANINHATFKHFLNPTTSYWAEDRVQRREFIVILFDLFGGTVAWPAA